MQRFYKNTVVKEDFFIYNIASKGRRTLWEKKKNEL